ncbi:uncharacterized protein ISCGN_005390 [Ixodes scapularis]
MSHRPDSRDPAGCTEAGEGGPATCTRGSKARTYRLGSKPSAVAPDAGVVLVENYSWKQTRRGNPLLVVRERNSQAREYSFSGSYTRPNASVIKYYVCLACRKKKEKRHLRSTELPRMKVLGSGEVYDMRNALHLCMPLTSSQVTGKHYERDQRLSLLNCSALCPKEVYEVVQNNFKKELSLCPVEEREDIQRRLPSYKSVKALYYRKIRPGGVRGLRFSAAMQSEQASAEMEPNMASSLAAESILQAAVPSVPLSSASSEEGLQATSCAAEPAMEEEEGLQGTSCAAKSAMEEEEGLQATLCVAKPAVKEECLEATSCVEQAVEEAVDTPQASATSGKTGGKPKSFLGVPVRRFFWKHTQNGNPLLVVKEGGASAREYTFSSKYGRPGLPPVRYYVCLGCRREREGKALPGRSLPRIKVLEDGRVFDMATAPHLCSPLTMAQVAGKHFERDHRLSLPNCSARRAKDAYEAMRANLSEQLSKHPEEERQDIERFLPSFKSVSSMYYRKMRQSGKRWVPYGELQPLAPRAGLEPATDTPGEAPVVSTTDVPFISDIFNMDCPEPNAFKDLVLGAAYSLAPECVLKVAEQDLQCGPDKLDVSISNPSTSESTSQDPPQRGSDELEVSSELVQAAVQDSLHCKSGKNPSTSESTSQDPPQRGSDELEVSSQLVQAAVQDSLHCESDKSDPSSAYPLAPTCVWKVEAQDPFQYRLREGATDDAELVADDSSEVDASQEAPAASHCDLQEKQKPPNGVSVREFFWKQTLRGNPLLMVKGEDSTVREYIFNSKYGRPGAPMVKYYVCLGCRKEREAKALPGGPLARMKVLEDGRVFDMSNTPHFCTPLSMAQVAGKHFERDHRLSLPNSRARRAKDAYEEMRVKLADFLNEHPAEEREDIERSLPSFKSVKSMYYRRMRESGRRWAPYSEPTKQVSGAETEPASEESCRETSDFSTTCKPHLKGAFDNLSHDLVLEQLAATGCGAKVYN